MALDIFGDFSFVGGDNSPANAFQDRQACINWYVEASPSKASKTVTSLLGCPGLIQLAAAPGGGAPGFSTSMTAWPQPYSGPYLPVRGMWVLPGQTQALVVISNVCYLVTIGSYGSSTVTGSINLNKVGTLASSSGPVAIRDNGTGGYAIIVDGPNYYLYNVAGQTLTQGSDSAWLGSNTVAYIDGWWVFNRPGTPVFYTNAAPYSTSFNGSLFSLKDSFSDKLIAVRESKEELWLTGEKTTEIWYNAGGQYFPFQRLVGTLLQVGCMAVASIARFSSAGQEGLAWLARSTDQGENIVVRTRGLTTEVISTPAVSDAIAQYPVTSDAVAYTYQEDTHEFYVLSFPSADRTWVYDGTLPPELAWHQRLSYDPYAAAFHRHRSNAYMNFAGMRIVGDYQNGALYQMTRMAQNDAGWPMLARRRAPHIWDKETRGRTFTQSLQVDFSPGQGQSAGLGANPQAYLTLSRDGGASLGSVYSGGPVGITAPMGAIGQTRNRTMWRKLGWARDTVPQLDVIAPVNRDITGATLRAHGEM